MRESWEEDIYCPPELLAPPVKTSQRAVKSNELICTRATIILEGTVKTR